MSITPLMPVYPRCAFRPVKGDLCHLIGEDGLPIAGLYRADRLHLNDDGYAKWNAIIGPVIREEWERAAK